MGSTDTLIPSHPIPSSPHLPSPLSNHRFRFSSAPTFWTDCSQNESGPQVWTSASVPRSRSTETLSTSITSFHLFLLNSKFLSPSTLVARSLLLLTHSLRDHVQQAIESQSDHALSPKSFALCSLLFALCPLHSESSVCPTIPDKQAPSRKSPAGRSSCCLSCVGMKLYFGTLQTLAWRMLGIFSLFEKFYFYCCEHLMQIESECVWLLP